MKLNLIINRYIFNEMIPPFIITIVFFSFIFLMRIILDITNMIVNYQIGISTFLLIIIYSMPYFLEFIIPMSVMIAVLLTFLRMSGDNEIVALKSCGVSIYRLLPPVLIFCMMGCMLTAVMAIYGLPWGKMSMKKLAFEVASSNLNYGIKQGQFNDSFKDIMLYINSIDKKDDSLLDVFIEDQRSSDIVSTIVAPKGTLSVNSDKMTFHLRLYNGTINQVGLEQNTAHSINFDTYDMSLDLKKVAAASAGGGPKGRKEMSLTELIDYIKNAENKDGKYYSSLIEFHKKFSIPFACIALGILAVPLGIQSNLTKKSAGLGFGIVFFLLYYLMLSAGVVFGEVGAYPPIIGMWVPNIVLGGAGVYLLIRTANDRPVEIILIPLFLQRLLPKIFKNKFSGQ